MDAELLRIHVDRDIEVGGAIDRATDCRPETTPGLLLAHGANNRFDHPLLTTVARHLAQSGTATVLRFNFPYAERGAYVTGPRAPARDRLSARARRAPRRDGLPSRAPLHRGEVAGSPHRRRACLPPPRGEGLLASGLIFLRYPLHAPGRKDRLRTEALRRIDVPSLFVCGTRDPLCRSGPPDADHRAPRRARHVDGDRGRRPLVGTSSVRPAN